MKRLISLLLATLMIVTVVPAFGLAIAAEGDDLAPETTTTYVVYDQDFEGLSTEAASNELLESLGWYIPAGKEKENLAKYSIVTDENGNKVLRVSTETYGIVGLDQRDSIVTVFNGDIMSLVRNGDFELSYDLTYRKGTTNAAGYSAVLYNYNEKTGRSVLDDNAAAYGLVALRACGTGMNSVYYPVSGGSAFCVVEGIANSAENVMSNRYMIKGAYHSLYARLFMEDPSAETADTVRSKVADPLVMIDKTVSVKLAYNVKDGVSVYVNDVLVSVPSTDAARLDEYSHSSVWDDFITRTTGASLGLLTKAGIVADIDNINLTAASVADTGYATELPELVITEVCATGYKDTTWAEFVEIYNTSDKPVDLTEYSFGYVDVTTGTENELTMGSNVKKYANYGNLGNYMGHTLESKTDYYLTEEALEKIPGRYVFVDEGTTLTKGVRYIKTGGEWVAVDRSESTSRTCKVHYVDKWNSRYSKSAVDYEYNTLLNPGECAIIYTIYDSVENCWTNSVNAGSKDRAIVGGFRKAYKNRGLSPDTKVIAFNAFNLADSAADRRYFLAKSCDENGEEINYKNVYITDTNYDKYLVSYCDYNSSLVSGMLYEGATVTDPNFGKGGSVETNCSGVFLYGVDASYDARRGTLYMSQNKVNNGTAHVGKLAGYQELVMRDMYKKNDGTLGQLAITEIVPHTFNLAGDDKSAFTAIEVTNTTASSLDLYRYALIRTEVDAQCSNGKGFTRATMMRAGNPVEKGVGNGAYYYFVENHISNPESCIIKSGESVVIWFINDDTYSSYARDDDFGFDYFRQYWVNQGNEQLALKDANGEYLTKVIAVDGNDSEVTNLDNATRVFSISAKESAVYGVATASNDVKQGLIKTQEVVSIAVLGSAMAYYNLKWSTVQASSFTYYANILDRTMPANTAMRYVAGVAGSSKCSALGNSLKVQYWKNGGGVWSTNEEGKIPNIELICNSGMMEPRLGTVNGEEVVAIKDKLFIASTDEAGNITYRYFDTLRTDIVTLQGAALNTAGETPLMRFDNAVPANVYNSLVATYNDNVEIGMLIVKTELLGDMTTFTKADLDKAGIEYKDLKCTVLYRTAEYVVLSSAIEVSSADYNTSYTAIGYMNIKMDETTTKTYWSTESSSGVLTEIAADALADVAAVKDDNYIYSDITADSVERFSRYTSAVQRKLLGYLGL